MGIEATGARPIWKIGKASALGRMEQTGGDVLLRGSMWFPWRKTNRATDVPDALRANFEELGETVVAQIVGRPYTHAAGSTPGVPAWAGKEDERQHALSWLREKRKRANWKVSIAPALTLIVIGIASSNLILTIRANRPELVSTHATLVINPDAKPPEWVTLSWNNIGKRSALRGTVTLFTVSNEGNRHEKFAQSEIIAIGGSTALTPTFGYGSAYLLPVDMHKFLGLFLACIKYHDEANNSYKQRYLFRLGGKIDNYVTTLDEIPSTHQVCPK
jgi:hypothetical protein